MNEPKVIYEDRDIMVVDKPAHFVVNKSDTTGTAITLQGWAETKIQKELEETDDQEFKSRGGIVHRLDKETSGVIVIAKNQQSFRNLQSQFKMRTTQKTYIALVHGELKPQEGVVKAPIGRLPWNRKRFGVIAGGRDAETAYKVIGHKIFKGETLSLIQVTPLTGRTHQIRVHLKHLGHPIYADFAYGGRKISREDRLYLDRVFLHAKKLCFAHPATGNRVCYESELPSELETFISD